MVEDNPDERCREKEGDQRRKFWNTKSDETLPEIISELDECPVLRLTQFSDIEGLHKNFLNLH